MLVGMSERGLRACVLKSSSECRLFVLAFSRKTSVRFVAAAPAAVAEAKRMYIFRRF